MEYYAVMSAQGREFNPKGNDAENLQYLGTIKCKDSHDTDIHEGLRKWIKENPWVLDGGYDAYLLMRLAPDTPGWRMEVRAQQTITISTFQDYTLPEFRK